VSLPDLKGRESILKVHLHKIKYASSVDPLVIARGTPGFSGADLANIINESALIAARRDKRLVTMNELEEAKDKVMMGTERKSLTMRDEERKLTAYHEGGHAIIALNCPASDPIHKATIIPRGRALGMVMRLPEHDRVSMTREKIEADLAVSMGGRVAEEIIFGYDKITSGASSDIKHATGLARAMVTEWGMSDEVGPIFYGGNKNDAYLNGGSTANKDKSGEVSNLIESEIKKIIDAAYKRATKILTDNIEKLHMLADALLKYETLSGDEIKKLLRGENIDKKDNDDDAKGKKSSLGDIDFGLGNNVQEA
jgi:cell division protease FtsH